MSRPPRVTGEPTYLFGIRATDAERESWMRCANKRGMKPSEWARDQLNRAARRAERSRR